MERGKKNKQRVGTWGTARLLQLRCFGRVVRMKSMFHALLHIGFTVEVSLSCDPFVLIVCQGITEATGSLFLHPARHISQLDSRYSILDPQYSILARIESQVSILD